MALDPSQSQKSSRWGSFLSSVESRLDTILAEEDPRSQQRVNAKPSEQPSKKAAMAVPPIRPASPARPGSGNRAQERLNEKLARAMASKNLAKAADASPMSSGVPSRTGSPANARESPRGSGELPRESAKVDIIEGNDLGEEELEDVGATEAIRDKQATEDIDVSKDISTEPDSSATNGIQSTEDETDSSTQSPQLVPDRSSMEATDFDSNGGAQLSQLSGTVTPSTLQLPSEYEKAIIQLRADNEATELRRQAESHDLLEKIDSLQAKLQYLTKEAAEAARAASAEAKHGSVEQKLADKDEKIALLIEEGQKLSRTELKHMTTIKKLRNKSTEDDKAVADAKQISEKHEKSANDAFEKARRAGVLEKQASERLRNMSKLEKDLDAARKDRDNKESLIRDLQTLLSELTSAAKQAEEKARLDALGSARKRATELEDELSGVKIEKEFAEKEHQNALRELKEKSEREKERTRVAEIERKGELNILESRLEAYRARAEEASAGQGGDVQAKLLRQIETLQNQYGVASENWQGIEGSLLSRVGVLEKERDDLAKREAETRRKARETNTKCRRTEDELERAISEGHDLDAERSSLTSQLKHLRDQLNKSEAEVINARNDLSAERESWGARQAHRLEEERSRMREEFLRSAPANIFTQMRTESPAIQTRPRKSSINAGDHPSPHSRRVSSYQGLGLSNTTHSPHERPLSRRSSTFHMTESPDSKPPTSHPLNRTDSMSTVPNISLNNGIPETPSIDYDARPGADDDFFNGVHTPATPPERTINDLVSVSTAAAGPSVQLVERMSAAVRRLESEKAAHKDELVRLTQQRDEAREQVVELMRDNDGKKAVDDRLKALEKESGELRRRYETTLEMLGEKSEKVEELKADIVDLKTLLREMVEERVK